jgi:hypothetical protein
LNAKIQKELAANEGSTVLSDRRERLCDCVAQKIDNKWENQYAELERCVVMPAVGTKLYTWQLYQLGNGDASLNTKILKELAENEEGTVWSDRRTRLVNCVAQKIRAKIDNKWESKYAEFERCVGMPAVGIKLYTWQSNQMSTGAGSLNAKIQKELEENEGSTMWSDRRARLDHCVAQKRRE